MLVHTVRELNSGKWRIETICEDSDNVWPHTEKDTAEEAIARLMQWMGCQTPVYPQDWPERVEVDRNG
jgi:hypothetical protein